MNRKRIGLIGVLASLLLVHGCSGTGTSSPDQGATTGQANDAEGAGTAARPLRVLLIPADGGTEEGTRSDFEPVFKAITRAYDLHFAIRVGQSYSAVVQGMINEQVDIAFFGPVTYHQAKEAGAAELLAVAELGGESVYYAGIFVRADSGVKSIEDLRQKSVAFGDVNSTSSFSYPMAMILEAGLDPVRDLQNVYLTGTHANALQALASGKADAAAASFDSFEKAVQEGKLDAQLIKPVAKSDPIPYPPLAMHSGLDSATKTKLREAFNSVHQVEGITASQIRGYGGKRVDRYNADYSQEEFDRAMSKLARVTKELKEEILRKASTVTNRDGVGS